MFRALRDINNLRLSQPEIMRFQLRALAASLFFAASASGRFVMYADEYVRPSVLTIHDLTVLDGTLRGQPMQMTEPA